MYILTCIHNDFRKYRLSKPSPEASLESESSARRTSIYSTSSSSSFDPSKYPSLPPAYSAISPTTGLDPPPYVFTASPTDAAEEVGEGPPPYQQINVWEELVREAVAKWKVLSVWKPAAELKLLVTTTNPAKLTRFIQAGIPPLLFSVCILHGLVCI